MFAGFGNRTADGPRRFLTIHLRLVGLLLKGEIENATDLMREHMRLAKAQSLRGYFGPAGVGQDGGAPGRDVPGGSGTRRRLTTSRSRALQRDGV